jgi:hypothetical protein
LLDGALLVRGSFTEIDKRDKRGKRGISTFYIKSSKVLYYKCKITFLGASKT